MRAAVPAVLLALVLPAAGPRSRESDGGGEDSGRQPRPGWGSSRRASASSSSASRKLLRRDLPEPELHGNSVSVTLENGQRLTFTMQSGRSGLVYKIGDSGSTVPVQKLLWAPDFARSSLETGRLLILNSNVTVPLWRRATLLKLSVLRLLAQRAGVETNIGTSVLINTGFSPAPPMEKARRLRSGTCPYVAFVHINKAGGTAMLQTLAECCYQQLIRNVVTTRVGWFHAIALWQRDGMGQAVWDQTYSFAFVRNPWSRQLSMFFFLMSDWLCGSSPAERRNKPLCDVRMLPRVPRGERKLTAADFQEWVRKLYTSFPPGSKKEHLFASNPHGNDIYPSFGASQHSWLSDEQGNIIVKDVFRLEELGQHWPRIQQRVRCGLLKVPYSEHEKVGRGGNAGRVRLSSRTRTSLGNIRGGHVTVAPSVSAYVKRSYQDYYDNATRAIVAEYMQRDIAEWGYTFEQ